MGKTLELLLRYKPELGELKLDAEGWVATEAVAVAVGRLRGFAVTSDAIVDLARTRPQHGIEVEGDRVRALRTRRRFPHILYLATTQRWAQDSRERTVLTGGRAGALTFYTTEDEAWRAAHRRRKGVAAVLFIDANRARAEGLRFRRGADGTYQIRRLARRYVLNLTEGFAFQRSAGGFLVRCGPDGTYEVGLVRVRRRRSSTWEVAKGKSEPGEAPWETAIREVQEETGIEVPLEIRHDLGIGHYAFMVPPGVPRLKVLYLYVIEVMAPIERVAPAEAEGIREVAFFPAGEAVDKIVHDSLRQPAQRLLEWIEAQRPGR